MGATTVWMRRRRRVRNATVTRLLAPTAALGRQKAFHCRPCCKGRILQIWRHIVAGGPARAGFSSSIAKTMHRRFAPDQLIRLPTRFSLLDTQPGSALSIPGLTFMRSSIGNNDQADNQSNSRAGTIGPVGGVFALDQSSPCPLQLQKWWKRWPIGRCRRHRR